MTTYAIKVGMRFVRARNVPKLVDENNATRFVDLRASDDLPAVDGRAAAENYLRSIAFHGEVVEVK